MKQKNLEFFEKVAIKRDEWKKRNNYYWGDLENFSDYLIPEYASVLEVGCGTGDLLANLKTKKVTGIDFSSKMIEIAKKKYPQIDFFVMEAENITLDKKFDYIVISNTIGYLEDIQQVFAELKKISHKHTKVIVTYHNFLWQPLFSFAELIGLRMKQPEQNWLSRVDIKNLLYLSGFDAYKEGERLIFPFYIPILSTILNKYFAKFPFLRKLCITDYVIAKPLSVAEETEWKNRYSVSVVIPARNESGNIENAILRTPKMGSHTEIIFIEGNSTDDTWDKIQEIAKKYKDTHDIKIGRQDGKGKGDAVRKGYDMATGDILMILDADLTVPPEDLPKFYNAIASGKGEFINGSRLVYNMDKEAMRFLNLLGNKFFSMMFTWLLDQRFKDTLCGTKVLFKLDYDHLKAGRKFFGDFDPFGDFDLIFGASKLNLKIIEIPIRYKERTYGETNISRFKHGMILLRMCAFASKKIKFI
ncbi:MAG: type 12 methyltransferase [Candidatus Moranbacteria bacterium GW2011_GWF2_34_56]|nr:MAG: type 12 methyltransferase [Candidatus Moranbacteria bacterium GW2011_GWF1_34_10]KKP64340.1 MAG: type 12 methyltransferase [Candidatus Moranbacteria bacterium GW2011_GWF2_34_56]HBI16904.1 glycosyl transferase [Candidatus Moranbacteria bacterium]